MSTKDEVLKIVKNALGGAQDNLYHAKMSFRKMSDEQLKEPYGQSGESCGSILAGYQAKHDDIKKCLEWVEHR